MTKGLGTIVYLRADTVATLLAYFRKFEPKITFDDLWGS